MYVRMRVLIRPLASSALRNESGGRGRLAVGGDESNHNKEHVSKWREMSKREREREMRDTYYFQLAGSWFVRL